MSDTRQYEGIPGLYRVNLKFTARGEERSKTYTVRTVEHTIPYNLAVLKLEEDLIDEGFNTFEECGCCLDDDVELVDFDIFPLNESVPGV
jgi:hypothetical protein